MSNEAVRVREDATAEAGEITTTVEPSSSRRPSRRQAANVLAGAILLLGLGLAFNRATASSTEATADDQVVDRVRTLVQDLPAEETPIVATIDDVDGLILQGGFYVGAANGDRVVVFPNSGQAVIYRPNSDAIVKSGTTSASGSN